MKALLFVICVSFISFGNAQRLYNSSKKISNANGTFFLSWGYNRSFYTKSDIELKGAMYDFSLQNVKASDDPTKNIANYFKLKTAFQTQFNLRTGYYFRNKYALNLALSNSNYLVDDGNQVVLNGSIDSSLNAVWQGDYKNKAVITNRSDFHLQHRGFYYAHVELMRTDKLYQSRNKYVALSSNLGFGLGAMITNTRFDFAQKSTTKRSLSGFGISAFAALRLEFLRHVFLQAELSGGSINLPKNATSKEDHIAFTKSQFWFGQRSLSIGFFHYFKPASTCSDCPVW